jgi:4-hydroxy-3-polyprenylbenzoate decarboxylase
LRDPNTTWVETLLASMTLDDKIGQMLMPQWSSGSAATNVSTYKVGGFIFLANSSTTIINAVNSLQAQTSVPLLFSIDCEAGSGARITDGTRFPMNMGLAATLRTDLAREQGRERIPVAISLGGDPAVMWSGSAPLPPGIDEFLLAGWLRGRPVELVRCVTQPLEVPAQAEIVIEGYVDPAESRLEGPFGDHTGFYTPPAPYPVLHITAVTHRRHPIYPTTIVGKPPMEDYWMGKATERLFLPLMRLFQGEIVDVNMPPPGVFHNLLFVSIKKRYPGHARKVINGLWGLGLMMLTKCIVVFDEDVDVQNLDEALFHMFGNVDWSRDVIIQEGPVDALDHASYRFAFGGKIGIDATRKLPEEGYTRGWPTPITMREEIKARVTRRWAQYGLD